MDAGNEGDAGAVFVQLMKNDINDQTSAFIHSHYRVTPAEI